MFRGFLKRMLSGHRSLLKPGHRSQATPLPDTHFWSRFLALQALWNPNSSAIGLDFLWQLL